MRGVMNVPTARRDKMIQVDEGRQQEAGEYTAEIADERPARQNDDQRPRETAHRRVRHVVKQRALRLVPPLAVVLESEIAEDRAGADRARQEGA